MEKFLPIHQSLYYYTRNIPSPYWKFIVEIYKILRNLHLQGLNSTCEPTQQHGFNLFLLFFRCLIP